MSPGRRLVPCRGSQLPSGGPGARSREFPLRIVVDTVDTSDTASIMLCADEHRWAEARFPRSKGAVAIGETPYVRDDVVRDSPPPG
ncbi:hypothetical protein [Streptomyces sp. R41]|uniref:Uncharacterized protein n=1 Tax=Streptomyces sp. R41 TaxID=3238632 RepID=A0AB39R7Q3_9ACTN